MSVVEGRSCRLTSPNTTKFNKIRYQSFYNLHALAFTQTFTRQNVICCDTDSMWYSSQNCVVINFISRNCQSVYFLLHQGGLRFMIVHNADWWISQAGEIVQQLRYSSFWRAREVFCFLVCGLNGSPAIISLSQPKASRVNLVIVMWFGWKQEIIKYVGVFLIFWVVYWCEK